MTTAEHIEAQTHLARVIAVRRERHFNHAWFRLGQLYPGATFALEAPDFLWESRCAYSDAIGMVWGAGA
jgi:hypothetical protein